MTGKMSSILIRRINSRNVSPATVVGRAQIPLKWHHHHRGSRSQADSVLVCTQGFRRHASVAGIVQRKGLRFFIDGESQSNHSGFADLIEQEVITEEAGDGRVAIHATAQIALINPARNSNEKTLGPFIGKNDFALVWKKTFPSSQGEALLSNRLTLAVSRSSFTMLSSAEYKP